MALQAAVQEVFDVCRTVDDELEVTFDADKITIYWKNLRFDLQPKDLGKALKIIKDAKALGARFE